MKKHDADKFLASLDQLGEDEVRKRRADRMYGGDKIGLVDLWLDQKAQERVEAEASRNEASSREQIRIARSAKNAAWAAAIAAIIAATSAIIALTSSS